MLTQQKPLMRALRRSLTSTPSSSASNSSSPSSSSSSSSWIHLRSVFLVVASSSSPLSSDRGSLKSPWSRRRRKHALLSKQWKNLFNSDGRFCDGGIKFLKKVRSGGVDPSIRAEVWPFLLGVYDLNSSKEDRDSIRNEKRKEYDNLRMRCRLMLRDSDMSFNFKETTRKNCCDDSTSFSQVLDSPGLEEVGSARGSVSAEGGEASNHLLHNATVETSGPLLVGGDESGITGENVSGADSESSNSDSSEETEDIQPFLASEGAEENILDDQVEEKNASPESQDRSKSLVTEDFPTWQRIIRLDAVRANAEWIIYSPSQAAVSETKARRLAESVGLKDYDHLEPYRIFHAARLVAILEAYALYDSEIGYCQGMSDLLSPIISVMEEDFEAFWCFVGFMKKARHNFRLDEVGIRRQLNIVSKIIKGKDSHLYGHLEKLQAEDCFFVYRMVVVLFRRELNFEQTLCLWEVMWADQAAIRAGITKSAWGRMRLRAPPSDDLLLYAIAACVLQRRKLIIEKYSSMDEIMRECNSMAGHLDVWKLLDDAHDLVVTLHEKI
ncbi:rab GTPase-activating protein 22-like isoform X2 [Actinidia eriantha]|uniref:rab GTPase-activating protein 22-like isoform X2 n=1 Tax=Actinidia eriantha TaxID=165200 RepID=UPI00258E5FE9|nr:rab GTPase-activating protein 22-like isoform X2 [Actinidia eriantha]